MTHAASGSGAERASSRKLDALAGLTLPQTNNETRELPAAVTGAAAI